MMGLLLFQILLHVYTHTQNGSLKWQDLNDLLLSLTGYVKNIICLLTVISPNTLIYNKKKKQSGRNCEEIESGRNCS